MVWGISREEFLHLNPTKLKPYEEAYKRKQDEIDLRNWHLGIYTANALLSTLGNSSLFRDKSATPNQYPKYPMFSFYDYSKHDIEDEESNERLAVLEMEKYALLLKKERG